MKNPISWLTSFVLSAAVGLISLLIVWMVSGNIGPINLLLALAIVIFGTIYLRPE